MRPGAGGRVDSCRGCARRVTLRVKAHPVFVSDATVADAMDTIDAMASSADADVAAMGARWRVHLSSGAWVLVPDFAWCQPQPFWSLPEPVAAELGNRVWSSSRATPTTGGFSGTRGGTWRRRSQDVTCCFPRRCSRCGRSRRSSGAGSRVRKKLTPKEKHPGDWMTSGTFGCAQLNAAPAGQHAVASLATALPPDASFAGGGGRVKGVGGEGGGGLTLAERERLDLAKTLVALANASRELARTLRSAPARSSVTLGSAPAGHETPRGTTSESWTSSRTTSSRRTSRRAGVCAGTRARRRTSRSSSTQTGRWLCAATRWMGPGISTATSRWAASSASTAWCARSGEARATASRSARSRRGRK